MTNSTSSSPVKPPPAHNASAGREETASPSAPLPPSPPPPPPPPEEEMEQMKNHKKMDFREIFAIFHNDKIEKAQSSRFWENLWQTTLVEAKEEHRKQQKQRSETKKKSGDHEHAMTPAKNSGAMSSRHAHPLSGGLDHLKRARQGSSLDSEQANKISRLNRFPNRQKGGGGGSKLMQKLGGSRGS